MSSPTPRQPYSPPAFAHRRPVSPTPSRRVARRIIAVTSLGLAGLIAGLLAGCSGAIPVQTSPAAPAAPAGPVAPAVSYDGIAGNWQFSSSSPAAARLSTLGGSLSVSGLAVSGTLHPLTASAPCAAAAPTKIPVSGTINSAGVLTMTSSVAGGTLTVTGTISSDRHSLLSPTYSIVSGPCASPAAAVAVSARDTAPTVSAQQFQPLSGTYSGTLTDDSGAHFPLTSILTQTSQPDADGLYHLQGSASSPGNGCLPPAVAASASTVTGSAMLATYTDAATGTTINAVGTSSPDGSSITITSWTMDSSCGSDSGTGSLTRQ